MYYVFMFSEYLSSFLCVFLEQITSITYSSWCSEHWISAEILCKPLFDSCKTGSLMICIHEAPRHTALTWTVSANASNLPRSWAKVHVFTGSRRPYTVSFRHGLCYILPRCSRKRSLMHGLLQHRIRCQTPSDSRKLRVELHPEIWNCERL
jgi:hypothetical protein